MFAISLSSCGHYNANFKLDQSVFAIHDSPLYFEIREDNHPSSTHGNPHPRCFANAFLSPGGK